VDAHAVLVSQAGVCDELRGVRQHRRSSQNGLPDIQAWTSMLQWVMSKVVDIRVSITDTAAAFM
jgi:hypothetical protein